MAIMTKPQFTGKLKSIRSSTAKVRDDVQALLIAAAVYCVRDSGTTEPFNQILDAVGDGTRKAGITAWAETWAPVRIKDGKFVLNKTAYRDMDVTGIDLEDFAAELAQTPGWWESTEKEAVNSIWDSGKFLKDLEALLDKKAKKADGFDANVASVIRTVETQLRILHTKLEEAAEVVEEEAE